MSADARSRCRTCSRCSSRSRRCSRTWRSPRSSSRTRSSRPPPAAAWSRSRSPATSQVKVDQDRPRRRSTPRTSRCSQDMVLAAVNEALRTAQELAATKMGGASAAWTWRPRRPRPRPGRAARGRVSLSTSYAPPVQRLVTELSKLPGHRQPHGPAPGLPHPARLRRGRQRAGRRDPRGQGADRAVRGLLQPDRRAALPHLPGRAPRPRRDLRRRGAQRRDPDGAHARVPRASTTCSAARSRRSTASTPRT